MWKPFHYDTRISVALTAEVTIQAFGTHHVSLNSKADLHIWGPDFAGHARISVKVMSVKVHFSIDFGASPASPDPIAWSDFNRSFLPQTSHMVSLSVVDGLEQSIRDDQGHTILVVNRKDLVMVTNSALPIQTVTGTFSHTAGNKAFGLAPMNKKQKDITASQHTVTISGAAATERKYNIILIDYNIILIDCNTILIGYNTILIGYPTTRQL